MQEIDIQELVKCGILGNNALKPKKCKYAEAARLEAIERAQSAYLRNILENKRFAQAIQESGQWAGVLGGLGECEQLGRQSHVRETMRLRLGVVENRKWALKRRLKTDPDSSRHRNYREALATPAWVDHAKIKEIYAERDRLAAETGIPHHVDHIYPIAGKLVCGLHVHDNMRAIPARVNRAKAFRSPPEDSL